MTQKYVTLNQLKSKRHPNKKNIRKIRKDIRKAVHAHELAKLREMQKFSQEDLANILGIHQSNVSRTERNPLEKTEVGTLLAYVEGLNLDLEINVLTENGIVKLLGPTDIPGKKRHKIKSKGMSLA